MHLCHHSARGRIAYCGIGKILQPQETVHQRARQHILDAELAVEAALGIGPIGMREPPRMRPRLDFDDVGRVQAVSLAQVEHRIGGGMRAAAAGMALERDARVGEIERACPLRQHTACIEGAGAVVDRKESLRMFERVRIGGHALLREQRGAQPVARRLADVERLCHGAEIGLDAARH